MDFRIYWKCLVLNLDQGFLQSLQANLYIYLYQYYGSLMDEQNVRVQHLT